MANGFGGGFLQGFVGTTTNLIKLQLHKQRLEAEQTAEQERIKLLQQRLKGDQARLTLDEQEMKQRIIAAHQQAQRRQEAASAANLLTEDPSTRGFALDPQSQQELTGIVRKEAFAEGKGDTAAKFLELREDQKRRGGLADSLEASLLDEEFSPQQRGLAQAALRSYRARGLSDDDLFRVFDRVSGASGGGVTSHIRLAWLATEKSQRGERARAALKLLPDETIRTTTAQLALQAQGTGPEADKARKALEALEKLRSTGVGRRRRRRQQEEEEPPTGPQAQPEAGEFRGQGRFGSGWQKGSPGSGIKRFRRVD